MSAPDGLRGPRGVGKMTRAVLVALAAGLTVQVYSETDDEYSSGSSESYREIPPVFTSSDAIADGALSPVTQVDYSGVDELEATVVSELTSLFTTPKSWNPEDVSGLMSDDRGGDDGSGFTAVSAGHIVNETDFNPLIIIIPLALLLLITTVVIGFVIRGRKKKETNNVKQNEVLGQCEAEVVPMPMFEDDVPSVLELEMEDLDKWIVKDTGGVGPDSAD